MKNLMTISILILFIITTSSMILTLNSFRTHHDNMANTDITAPALYLPASHPMTVTME